ncbi:MAG TPA: response regulator [Candidatus Saccharimonadales bacterium]|nr:response regulator [Candidatus Saccharimonadales bacterium]
MSRSVLVVDDDHETLDVTSAVLRNSGYRVFTASSGKEGIASARRERPDLILLDINMDDMDGWSALRLLRLDEETGSIPVAMFSIRYDLNEKMEALKRSADDYIVKPFSIDDLLDRVARLTERGRGGAEPGSSAGETAWS